MTLVDKEAEKRETKKKFEVRKELARMLTLASKARSNTFSV